MFCLVFYLICLSGLGSFTFTGMPFGSAGNGASQADIGMMNAEIEKFTEELKKIDEFVANMSPEEQAEFFKQVDEVQQALSNMTPEEMNQLMEEMVSMAPELFGDIPPEMLYQPIAQPEALAPVIPEEVIPLPGNTLNPTSEAFLYKIEHLIQQLNEFLAKMSASPELSLSLNRWLMQGKVTTILPNTISWDVVYHSIELLVVRLSLLQEQAPGTNQYIHIENAEKNPVIFEIITQLNNNMALMLSKIETYSFGFKKITLQSKEAIKNILNLINPVIMNQKFNQAIDEILKLYESTAKKLKDSQQKNKEYALQFSKAFIPQQAVVAGSTIQESPLFDTGTVYNQDSYNNYSGFNNYNSNMFSGSFAGSETGLNWDSITPLSGSSDAKEELNKSEKNSEEKATKKESGFSSLVPSQQEDIIKKSLGEIEEKINSINDALQEQNIKGITNYLTNKKEGVDFILASYSISNLDKNISILTNNIKVTEGKISKLNETKQKEYLDQIKELYNKKTKNNITNFVDQMNEIQSDWSSFATKISREKQYSFFKIAFEEKAETEKKELPFQSTKTLFDLMRTCKSLSQTIDQLGKK